MPTPTLSPTPGPRILYEALFTRARSALTPTRTSAAAAGQRRERGESQLIGVAIVAGEVGWGRRRSREERRRGGVGVAGVQA